MQAARRYLLPERAQVKPWWAAATSLFSTTSWRPNMATKVFGGKALNGCGLTHGDGRGRLAKLVRFHADNGADGAPGWVQGGT